MRRSRCGTTLIELLVAVAVGTIVLGLGYRIYVLALRNDDIERARESAAIAISGLMNRVQTDIRGSSSATAGGGTLRLSGPGGNVTYRTTFAGVERTAGGRSRVYRDVRANFSRQPGSRVVGVRVESNATVHRRPINVELTGYAAPRN